MTDESAEDQPSAQRSIDGPGNSNGPATAAQLFGLHADAVEAVARGLTRDAHLAADVCQSVFSKVLAKHSDIPLGSERAWLLRVAKNEAIDVLRKRGREARHTRAAAIPLPLETEPSERSLLRDERAMIVREVIAELSPFDQEIVRRRFELGQTFAVIAEEIDKPLGTVLSRAHRLMKSLESRLRDVNDE